MHGKLKIPHRQFLERVMDMISREISGWSDGQRQWFKIYIAEWLHKNF